MKIKISKYPTHRWYHNFLFSKFGYKNEQKVSIRIDPWDTWSMDHTLAKIILPMLIQLKATKHSAPTISNKDVPLELQSDTIEDDVCATHFQKWDWVLDEMIFAFASKNIAWEEQFSSGEHDMHRIDLDNGTSEMVKGPNDTYKVDWEARNAYQQRMSNGFRLFGKYFENLWD